MTIKPRTIRSVRNARERLRDVAAARHAHSWQAREIAAEQLEREHDTLDDFLDEAPTILAAATGVHDLDRLADSTSELRLAVESAATASEAADQANERTGHELRERTRQLRSAERLAERVDRERRVLDARTEQHLCDDLVAARRR